MRTPSRPDFGDLGVPEPRNNSRRAWTDDQLRAAVATHRSWRAVARALGLRVTSTNNLRRHAARLNLDTSHFTGRRTWSDLQLRNAVASASSWGEVLRHLDVTDNADARTRAKGHAVRLRLDTIHLNGPSPDLPVDHRITAPRRHMLRRAATSIAAAWFALRGYDTAAPCEAAPYDLLVHLPEGIKRVQVKSTTRRQANGRWLAKVGRRPYSLDKTAGRTPYDPDHLDMFFVVDGAGGLYLIPAVVLAGRLEVCLQHYDRYRVGDASSLLTWADD